jgi:hypothetical protein
MAGIVFDGSRVSGHLGHGNHRYQLDGFSGLGLSMVYGFARQSNDIARKITAEEDGPKVLLASGYPDKLKESHGDLDGKVKVLPKPFNITQIRDALAELVG